MVKFEQGFRDALAIVSAFCVASATAAQDTGSHLRFERAKTPTNDDMSEADKYRSVLNQFAACVLKVRRREVALALESGRNEHAVDDKLRSILLRERCLEEGAIKFQGDLFRGALYTSLYREDYSKNKPVFNSSGAPIRAWMGYNIQMYKANIFLLGFADCVASADPENSRKLVLGPTAGKEEREAYNSLLPAFSPCMPKGADIKFSKTALFGLIAEALYLRAVSSLETGTNKTN